MRVSIERAVARAGELRTMANSLESASRRVQDEAERVLLAEAQRLRSRAAAIDELEVDLPAGEEGPQ